MNPTELSILLPEIIVLGMTAFIMIAGLFFKRKQSEFTYLFSQIALILAALFVWEQINWPTLYALHGMFILDAATTLSKLMILICAIFALAYAKPFFNAYPKLTHDYCLLFLFTLLGMMALV